MSARATKLFNYDLAVKKMWTFKPGYLGACIIAVAILGGIILGSLANVSTHTESTTAYEYKTDITGLFDVTQDPQFLDFNPASNYNGYTNVNADVYNPSGVNYVHTNIANNYRMLTEQPHAENGPSGTVNNSTNLPQYTFTYEGQPATSRYTLGVGSSELVYNTGTRTGYLMGYKVATMYDWIISVFGDLSQYQQITLTVNAPTITAPSTFARFGSATYWSNNGYYSLGSDTPLNASRTFEIDPVNLTYTFHTGNNNEYTWTRSLYTNYIFYGDCTQYETKIEGGHTYNDSHSTSLSLSYSSVVTRVGNYDYMLPAYGVQVNTDGGGTIWDNDQGTTNYDNYAVNIVFGPNFNTNTGQFDPIDLTAVGQTDLTLNRVGGGTDTITVICNSQGGGFTGWKISLNGMSLGSIGTFPAIMLSIQKEPYYTDGWQIKVYPVTSFTDYQNIEIDETPIRKINATAQYDLDNITFTDSAGNSLANISWSIYSTVVFMETYNAVFHNASINLYDYWPNMSSYRFALKNIALYGSSIVINGTTYPVHDQKITIDGKDYTLKNCYFSYSLDGNASITFNDINKTVDLGPIVTKTLTFNGNWGFNMGLYEGVASTKDVYDWNIKMFGDSLNTCVFIALGLLAVGALACIWLKVSLKFTDKVVLGAGALILVIMLVV